MLNPLLPDAIEEAPFHQALFCVYDGHGSYGDKVSKFVVNQVVEELKVQDILGDTDKIKQALTKAFEETDAKLKKCSSIDAELSGTTAVAMVLRQNKDSSVIQTWTAWAGDSRAVLHHNGKTVDLSTDQKPDSPGEQDRIQAAGGYVSPAEKEWGGPARVWLDANMTLPGLAMGRSIGDHLVKPVGVISTPEVRYQEISNPGNDSFIVLASDGVWEFLESTAAAKICLANMTTENFNSTTACKRLIETAASKWRTEEGDYRDDITAICIKLKDLFKC